MARSSTRSPCTSPPGESLCYHFELHGPYAEVCALLREQRSCIWKYNASYHLSTSSGGYVWRQVDAQPMTDEGPSPSANQDHPKQTRTLRESQRTMYWYFRIACTSIRQLEPLLSFSPRVDLSDPYTLGYLASVIQSGCRKKRKSCLYL